MDVKTLKKHFKENGGILKASQVIALGFSRSDLVKLQKQNVIERVQNGYYSLIAAEHNDIEIIKNIVPEGIICMDSALFHYGYIDRTPSEWHLAVNKDIAKSKFRNMYPPIKPYYLEHSTLDIGKTEENINGTKVYVYDRERVICDCFRYKNKIDSEMFTKAMNAYIKDSKKNISNLVSYAKKLRVYKSLSSIMEVLINA